MAAISAKTGDRLELDVIVFPAIAVRAEVYQAARSSHAALCAGDAAVHDARSGPARTHGQPVTMSEILPRSRRRGTGRSAAHDGTRTRPAAAPEVPWSPLEILSTEQVERILVAAYRVLEEAGLEIRSAAAREIFREAGALVGRRRATGAHRPGHRRCAAVACAGTLRAARPQPGARPARRRQRRELRPGQRRAERERP